MVRRLLVGQEADVVAAYEAGASLEELAARFGCSTKPVRRALLEAGVVLRRQGRPSPYDDKTLQHLVTDYLAGATIDELAARHGRTPKTVRKALEEHGVQIRSTGRRWPYDGPTERRIAQEYEKGATLRQLSEIYGGSDKSIRKAITKNGVAMRPPASARH